jgi:hypothetical protein
MTKSFLLRRRLPVRPSLSSFQSTPKRGMQRLIAVCGFGCLDDLNRFCEPGRIGCWIAFRSLTTQPHFRCDATMILGRFEMVNCDGRDACGDMRANHVAANRCRTGGQLKKNRHEACRGICESNRVVSKRTASLDQNRFHVNIGIAARPSIKTNQAKTGVPKIARV